MNIRNQLRCPVSEGGEP